MKNLYATLSFSTLLMLIISCGGTRNMQVEVMRPAQITITQEIKSIALLNRSVPTAKTGAEAILTGETPVQDKELSEECLRGLSDLLNTSNRFVVKRCEGTMNASDEKSLQFGAPLDWSIIDSLCNKYGVEGILVLEYFDTD
ncbi:MAG: DUF6340 family protein, partial [Flavobacteriales bacterium]